MRAFSARLAALGAPSRERTRDHLQNPIIVGNGTPVSNGWYPSETFMRVGLNVADDLTCGDTTQMLIRDPRQPS